MADLGGLAAEKKAEASGGNRRLAAEKKAEASGGNRRTTGFAARDAPVVQLGGGKIRAIPLLDRACLAVCSGPQILRQRRATE